MTETTNLNGRLEAFVNSLLQETNLSPTAIARKFSSFHKLSSPPDYRSVIDAGFDFVKHFELADNMPPELRGFHSIYNGHVQIVLKNHERTGAMLHTILHEIFEIIITKLNEKKVPPYKLTHYKTNLFAASVLMPKEVFFEFALKSDLDFLTIHNHEKYIHLSLQSLLLRLSYLFGLNKISYFGVIAENKKANYHQNYPLDRNAFNNFEMNTIV
ncbi:MAG: hypothetical protein KBB01_06870, partial [Candidatus Omnitrophica bacterium]|nr:hypothetical protein [Candidatus Omnitrophota bacterium]